MEKYECSFGIRRLVVSTQPKRELAGPHYLIIKPFAPELAAKVLEIFISLERIERLYIAPVTDDSIPNAIRKACKQVTAAGGIVIAPSGDILLIHRRGVWDLPKGKLEKNETIENAALREVQEETGLTELTLDRFITTTDHLYLENDSRILKTTHWFLMQWSGAGEASPQKSEGIMKVGFFTPEKALELAKTTFPTIEKAIAEYMAQKG